MGNEVQPILQIDTVKDSNTGRNVTILSPSRDKKGDIDPTALAGFVDAISNMKKSLDPKYHADFDQELNKKMGSFMERAYSNAFAETIKPLNDALMQAKNGEVNALAKALGMENLLLKGRLQQKASIEGTGTTLAAAVSAPPPKISTSIAPQTPVGQTVGQGEGLTLAANYGKGNRDEALTRLVNGPKK